MKKILLILFTCSVSNIYCSNITDAYKALSVFDYFKAKRLFYKGLKKHPSESSYGLSIIFHREDNPFFNNDSAAKYIFLARQKFKLPAKIAGFNINSESIEQLLRSICNKGYNQAISKKSIISFNHYLSTYYFSCDSLLNSCFNQRDSLAYEYYYLQESSDSVLKFLLSFPQSYLYSKAQEDFYKYQYIENVDENNPYQLKKFILHYRYNPYYITAENKLFDLIKKNHSIDSLYSFIKNYSSSQTKESAWKILYNLVVNNYSKEGLSAFLINYPDYPFSQSIFKEISLSQKTLVPLKSISNTFGFIDTLGNWVINPQYDDAQFFEEGFAGVCKNDSCFYIDKEGEKAFDVYFEELESFKNGSAIIKKGDLFYLINRSGQIISNGYKDITRASENLFVCKSNDFYGAINIKSEVIIPFSYLKIGNFKNEYAYYLSNHYGLINIHNKTLKAQWDWVSDVDENDMVIIKKDTKFGLIGLNEKMYLQPIYDYIALCQKGIYLLVKNNKYGFYNIKDNCFLTYIEYDYKQSFETTYYTNGYFFKLIKNDEVALMNENGKIIIDFGTYSNFFFSKENNICVQKKNKFGFLDKNLNSITEPEYDKVTHFENEVAIVFKNDQCLLINNKGIVLSSIKGGEIKKLNEQVYETKLNGLVGLIDKTGKLLLENQFISIEQMVYNLYRCKKSTDELFLFNCNYKKLSKIK